MEESGAPKKKEEKKEFAYLPTHTQNWNIFKDGLI
jgi:hypothetical protein